MQEKLPLIQKSRTAFLSLEIKKRLKRRLSVIKLEPQTILDMNESRELLTLYPDATIVNLETVSEQSVDLIVSNLTLCWIDNPLALLQKWKRALTEKGMVIFSTLGPATLGALNTEQIFPFLELQILGDTFFEAGFQSPVVERETITLTYHDAEKALEDMDTLGLSYFISPAANNNIYTRYQQMLQEKDIIEVPYEVFYGQAFQTVRVERPLQFVKR